jgi:hypothetical protein
MKSRVAGLANISVGFVPSPAGAILSLCSLHHSHATDSSHSHVLIGSIRLAPGTSTAEQLSASTSTAASPPSLPHRGAETGRQQQAPSPVGVDGAGGGPDEAVAGVGPRVPAGLRGGAHGGPALPVRRLRQRAAHVRLPRHLVRRRGHRAPLRRGRCARLEPRAAGP